MKPPLPHRIVTRLPAGQAHVRVTAWFWRRTMPIGLVVGLAGCAAGPNFTRPPAPKVTQYARTPLVATVATHGVPGGAAQHLVKGADVDAKWWRAFDSSALDALEQQALAHNPTLAAARAALKAAHEDVLAQRGTFMPSVTAGASASRQQDPAAALAPVPGNNAFLYSLFTPQLSISYTPDLFGVHRRTHESLQAQAQAIRFQAIAAWNTLTSNVAVAAVEVASLHAQVTATRKLVGLEKHGAHILQLRFKSGDASQIDVSAQQAQLAGTEANLAVLEKRLAMAHHALAVLVGAFPGQSAQADLTLADLTLPPNLPLSLPSRLVVQRPDVRMARANLHAASAAIGIAAAERLPRLELTADAGSTALTISKVFTSGTGFWGIAASLTAPIFEGGELKHHERAAKAAYVEAAQQYRATVLAAFQNVADTLTALDQDARALHAAATAAHAAQTTLRLSRLKLQHGYIGTFELLAAEQAWQQARIGLLNAEANRFADTAALYQALGGGWWHHPDRHQGQAQ